MKVLKSDVSNASLGKNMVITTGTLKADKVIKNKQNAK